MAEAEARVESGPDKFSRPQASKSCNCSSSTQFAFLSLAVGRNGQEGPRKTLISVFEGWGWQFLGTWQSLGSMYCMLFHFMKSFSFSGAGGMCVYVCTEVDKHVCMGVHTGINQRSILGVYCSSEASHLFSESLSLA